MMTFAEIDWNCWTPQERSVLCFIFRESEVLLILKKRGLGNGKINAPGGKIEPGESPVQAAIRETQEEVGLTPHDPRYSGELFLSSPTAFASIAPFFGRKGVTGRRWKPVKRCRSGRRSTPSLTRRCGPTICFGCRSFWNGGHSGAILFLKGIRCSANESNCCHEPAPCTR